MPLNVKTVGENGFQTLAPLEPGSLVSFECIRIWTPEPGGFGIRYSVRTCGVLQPEHRDPKTWVTKPEQSYITAVVVKDGVEQIPTTYMFHTFGLACVLTPEAAHESPFTDGTLLARVTAWFFRQIQQGKTVIKPEDADFHYTCPLEGELNGSNF